MNTLISSSSSSKAKLNGANITQILNTTGWSKKIHLLNSMVVNISERVSGKLPPEKFPPRKIPPGIFPPMLLNIPTWVFFNFLSFHYCHRHHWYYLKDCFVILCFESASQKFRSRCIKKIAACRPKFDNRSLDQST